MRKLIIVLAGAGALTSAAAAVFASETLEDCAVIADADARLACFDRLTRQRRGDGDPVSTPAQETQPAAPAQRRPRPANDATGVDEPAADQPEPRRAHESADPAAGFGRNRQTDAAAEVDRIEATIEQVRKGPLGRQIMTLSNGQVWMENEPGKRPIQRGQRVVVRRHRLHYEMELPSQPDIAVRRVE